MTAKHAPTMGQQASVAARALNRAIMSSTATACCGCANNEPTRSTVDASDLAASKSPAEESGQCGQEQVKLDRAPLAQCSKKQPVPASLQ